MSAATKTYVELGSGETIDLNNEEQLELSQLPALSVQTGNDFTRYVSEGLSPNFQIQHIDDGSNRGTDIIEHDPTMIHYFAEARGFVHYSQRTFGRTPNVVNKEWFDMKVENLTEFRKLKENLLSKPFMLEVFFDAERICCNTVYNMPRTCLIVTVNPKHPTMATLLSKAFSEADENFQNDTTFSIEINLRSALKQWYHDQLLLKTGEDWWIGIEGRWHLSIYNETPRVVFCPNYCAVIGYGLCCVLAPLFCLSYGGYKLYRHRACNTIDVKVTEPVFYPGVQM